MSSSSEKKIKTVPAPSKRVPRIEQASEYFRLLAEANRLEKKAKKFREEASEMKKKFPLLAALDNKLDKFEDEPVPKKRKKTEEMEVDEKSKEKEVKKSKVVDHNTQENVSFTPFLHFHTDPVTMEPVPCRELHLEVPGSYSIAQKK